MTSFFETVEKSKQFWTLLNIMEATRIWVLQHVIQTFGKLAQCFRQSVDNL